MESYFQSKTTMNKLSIPSLNDNFSFLEKDEAYISSVITETRLDLTTKEVLKVIFNAIDLTSLNTSDTESHIQKWCETISLFMENHPSYRMASICVYPNFVEQVANQLNKHKIRLTSVAGAFPTGQSPLEMKIKEIEWAIKHGAQEIDTVIPWGALKEKNYAFVFKELTAIRNACKDVCWKAIIESSELNAREIRIASDLAMHAGADFIKTSTGKASSGASTKAVFIMLHAIKDFYALTGKKVGIKPSGGISNYDQALKYLKLTHSIVGTSWITEQKLRFGASGLWKNLLKKLVENG